MKKIVLFLLLIISSCTDNKKHLEFLIKQSILTENWSLLDEFLDERVQCEICIEKDVVNKVTEYPNYIDTLHNHLIFFDKKVIIKNKLPEIFKNINEFSVDKIYNSGRVFENRDEFEIHIPRKDKTQIDLHFNRVKGKDKLVSIYVTP